VDNEQSMTNTLTSTTKTLTDSSTHADDGDDENDKDFDELVNKFIVTICQILCFPFAIDANEDIVTKVYKIFKDFNLFNKILGACMDCNSKSSVLDVPIGLITRLILTDEDLVELMIDQLNETKVADFMSKLLYDSGTSDNVIADLLSIFSHLSRKSQDVVEIIIKILQKDDKKTTNSFQILNKCLTGNVMLKARCCNLIGNLMKHTPIFYDVLKRNKSIFDNVVQCCQIDELNVRKSAIFAIGNSIYHNDTLYSYVDDILYILVNLLNDSLAKTRMHSTG
jgi:fused